MSDKAHSTGVSKHSKRRLFQGTRINIWIRFLQLVQAETAGKRRLYNRLVSLCILVAILLLLYNITIKKVNWMGDTLHQSNILSFRYLFQEKKNDTEDRMLRTIFSGYDHCKELTKPTESHILYRHTYWQAQEDGREDIVVYSAFYDNRPIAGQLPWIRILGVRRLSQQPLWCYVWYSQINIPFVTKTEIVKTGSDQRIKDGNIYSQNLFSCELKTDGFIPTHVSLVTRLCTNSTIYLPVIYSQASSNWTHNFGVCLEVNFGYFPPQMIVEWMEAHSMFGVTHVNLYNGSIDGRLDRVFDFYSKKGFLDLRQMPPAVNDYDYQGIRLGSPASLNDCMLRNMNTHRFLFVVDFDEIIVPRIHRNYLEMLQYIDKSLNMSQSFHTYTFRNAYFFQYFPEDETQPAFLKTLRFRHRAKPSDYLFGSKSFVDPRQCKSVFNHYCWLRFKHNSLLSIDVNTSIALSHHYRSKCPFDKVHCEKYDKEKEVDDVLLKYKDELSERVSRVLKDIGI